MTQKKLIIGGVIAVIASLMIILTTQLLINSNQLSTTLYLTSPVTTLIGTVEQVGNDFIVVSTEKTIQKPISDTQILPTPTITTRILTYKVIITGETMFNKFSTPVPSYFISPVPTPPLTAGDINVGDVVEILSMTDIRMSRKNEFKAGLIKLPPTINVIEGIVMSKEAAKLVVRDSSAKEYTVVVSPETEISHFPRTTDPSARPQRLTMNDLKTGMQVTIYSNKDIREQIEIKAVRIEPKL
jgi:hypothetical protein